MGKSGAGAGASENDQLDEHGKYISQSGYGVFQGNLPPGYRGVYDHAAWRGDFGTSDYYGGYYTDDGWFRYGGGPHAGLRARAAGYQRAGGRIMEDVCDRLTQHGYLDANGINVEVHNGIVTLTGTVDSRVSKRMAEDVGDTVAETGVTDVDNRLQIEGGQGR